MRLAPLAFVLCAALSASAAPAAPKRNTFKLTNEPLTPNPGPSALVHLPKGFKSDGPLNLIVHFHGIQNCVSVTVEGKNGNCAKGSFNQGHNLIAQADASGVNAALVALEVAFNKNNTDPGKLATSGFFAQVIDELLPKIGQLAGREYSRDDLGKIILTSHSGGYMALCETLANAGLPISGVLLFDSLYPNKKKKGPKDDACFNKYVDWVKNNADGRFGIVYTTQGGTMANSQQMSTDIKAMVDAGDYWDERKKPDAQILKASELGRRFVFVKTGVAHDDSVRKYYAAMLGKLGL
jgi:hypothetical protein